MRITCPRCGHSREVADDRLPQGDIRVTCPLCRQHFPLLPEEKKPSAGEKKENSVFSPINPPMPPPPGEDFRHPIAGLSPAGFWLRVVAALIDSAIAGLLQMGLVVLFMAVLQQLEGVLGAGHDETWKNAVTMLYGLVTGIAYYVFFTGHCGQTPGKMALRIKVVRDDGAELGYGRALIRETAGKFLSAALFGFGYLMVAFTRRKQGLHDKLAGSMVIKIN